MEFVIGILDDLLDGCTPERIGVWMFPEFSSRLTIVTLIEVVG